MKTSVFLLLCVISFSVLNAQETALEGIWNLTELINIDYNDTLKRSPEYIKEHKAIWELDFLKTGKFKQSSNMDPTKTMTSYEGIWRTSGPDLIVKLQIKGDTIDMKYSYEVNNDTLILRRSSQEGNHKIISKFHKK